MKKNYFLDRFKKLSSTELFKKKYRKDIVKTCKFCLKTSDETTFDNVPHVLPELFGKNSFTSNEECDDCNKLFGRFENDLANYISPYQTFIGQKTKNKVPTFQGRKNEKGHSTVIKNTGESPKLSFNTNISDFEFDEKNRTINLKLRKKKFIPINVYKGLVKVGLSLSPKNELSKYKKTIDWLSKIEDNKENIIFDIPLILIRTRFKNKYYSKPSAQLYKRKSNICENIYRPNLCLIVYSGLLVFQIFIPFCEETAKINPSDFKFEYDLFPAFILDLNFPKNKEKITLKIKDLPIVKYDMNHYEKVEEDELITLKYESIELS